MIRNAKGYRVGSPLLAALFVLTPSLFAAEKAETAIDRMKKDLYFLASDECEGRGIETEGINKAADYIAARFKELGLKPGLPTGYFQPLSIKGSAKLGAPNKLVLKGPLEKELEPKINAEWTVSGMTNKGKASGGIVFAGYGITVPNGYDDYKGIDAKGKIVLVIRQTPHSGNKDAPFPNAMQYAPLVEKIQNAEKHEAAGILFISDQKTAGKDDALMPFEYARGGEGATFPVMHIRRALADQLLTAANKNLADLEKEIDGDLKPRSFELKDWSAALEVAVERTEYKVKNVIGILEGKGPLANETIVLGAHYDHLGRGESGTKVKGSTAIHYGADDNGSGTTAILELARRFSTMKDREGRRLVFMTFTGEERGLLGSRFYCQNPVVPLKETVAMINLDMVGRLRPDPKTMKDKMQIGGLGSAKNFEPVIDELNKKYDFQIQKSRSGTGPSDHTSFYNKGVPVFFFFTLDHPEYHKPTDRPELINFEGMKKVVDMIEDLTIALATDKQKPEYQTAKAGKDDPPTSPTKGFPTIRFTPGDYDDDQSNGVLVGGVAPGGPADKAGLKEGDWIVEIGGKAVKNMNGYMKVMGAQKAGETLDFVVKRGDKKLPLKVTPIPPAQ